MGWLFFMAFSLWIFCFRGFLIGKLSLQSDALAYYEHFQFFFKNFARGVYPMWEFSRQDGLPAEFFLRRMGSFNPLYGILVIFHKLGLHPTWNYLWFLAGYYFLGMVGFYLLSVRIFNDRLTSFVAFLLLMFSSLGTRLFDSYILLIIIPMIWFFYFSVSFLQRPRKSFMLGATLCVMILLTTYVPFYFLNIVLMVAAVFVCVYFYKCPFIFSNVTTFIKKFPWFSTLCLVCVLLYLIPGCLFFMDGRKGETILPQRSHSAEDTHMVSVGLETKTKWGFEEDLGYAYGFQDYRKFKFAILYIPIFIFLILLHGLFLSINRKVLFFFLLGCLGLILYSHYLPIYNFLHEHIFYFKYFRNLHFFLWMLGIPVIVLFAAEQFSRLSEFFIKKNDRRWWLIAVTSAAHGLLLCLLLQQTDMIISSFITVILSWCLSTGGVFYPAQYRRRSCFIYILLLLVCVIQPVEVYHYLQKNAAKAKDLDQYRYGNNEDIYWKVDLAKENAIQVLKDKNQKNQISEGYLQGSFENTMYIGSRWIDGLRRHVHPKITGAYVSLKFVMYDNIRIMEEGKYPFRDLSLNMIDLENIAFVNPGENTDFLKAKNDSAFDERRSQTAEVLLRGDSRIIIEDSDVNYIKLKTSLKNKKFLVYTDSYHPNWKLYVDGKERPVYRAMYAFKGFWVPAGEHTVLLRYGSAWNYILNYGLVIISFFVFAVLVFLLIQDRKWLSNSEK